MHAPLCDHGSGQQATAFCVAMSGNFSVLLLLPFLFLYASAIFLLECPLNWRVGANSPSLCPTMNSVIYTGINLLPLCTANVCPTDSGVTVERRLQVLITPFFTLPSFIAPIFFSRCVAT